MLMQVLVFRVCISRTFPLSCDKSEVAKGMKLYDTAQGKPIEVAPLDGAKYRFYCCGPTVYGPAHIGNFRTFVLQDVLRRTLEISGLETYHVRNLTDVDDKTIKGAIAAGKPLKEFTADWTAKFHADCEALNCLPPHVEPSAVEHIPHQIAMIEDLIEKGHAYAGQDGSVYFKISSYSEYGKLSKLDTRELDLGKTQNTRVNNADEYDKDSLSDFVLWKARKEEDGEHYWESPWGQGRPGWHLECSAMIKEYLGDTFDLHGGGVDLVFPHHENEIAQSKCACGGDFAKHWFHVTHLLVDGGKMSKSLGDFYTLADLEEKGYTAAEVRYVLLGAHYRKPLNFTLDSLHAAREALGKLSRAMYDFTEEYGDQEDVTEAELKGLEDFGLFQEAWNVLQFDLNTQAAIGKVFAQLKRLRGLNAEEARVSWRGLQAVLRSLGVEVPVYEATPEVEVPSEVQELANQRQEAKAAQDWAKADAIRDELRVLGWEIEDSHSGAVVKEIN